MNQFQKQYYEKRAQVLVKNLRQRYFEAYYCATRDEALEQALSLIPRDSSVGWGGCLSAEQIDLVEAVRNGPYAAIDRDRANSPEERTVRMRQGLLSDVFLTGANAISMDGQMVNIDGMGNRVAAIAYGAKSVIVIAGMNKVVDTVEDAVTRARTVAAPINKQRFAPQTPCLVTGACADCRGEGSICNQFLITRSCRPAGRIKFILVGEDLGF